MASANHGDTERERFESPKQILSEMADGALDLPPPKRQEPSQSLTRGDLMALLLAHLIWRAHAAAWQQLKIRSLPKLRFARPAWTADRALLGENQLQALFAKAFAIAGTLRDRLDNPDGLPIPHVRSVLDQIQSEGDLQRLLMRRIELGGDQTDCIDRGFVPEATAVAAGAIKPEQGRRRVFVIADVGAGTCDFGAFVTVPGDGRGRIKELPRGRRVVLRGGNFLDQQVIALLKDKAGLSDGVPAAVAPLAGLKREASRIKEDLFRKGKVTERLANGQIVRADLGELLEREPMKDFGNELWGEFSGALSVAIEFLRGLTDLPASIEIILTGGGSQLPMVRDFVARAQRESNYEVTITDAKPAWVTDPNMSRLYAQLAVAIGGAMPVMPQQT
jgi:molecular chaperone HscA